MKLLKQLGLVFFVSTLSFVTNAAVITQGALTTNDDGSTWIIEDSLNNYQWLRFDVLKSYTYAETVSVLDTIEGGGWQIADRSAAIAFLNALHNGNSLCDMSTDFSNECGSINFDNGAFGDNSNTAYYDRAWFLSDLTQEVGDIAFDYQNGTSRIGPAYGSIATADLTYQVSWLLYRNVAPVPVPAAFWLFISGIIPVMCTKKLRNKRKK